ncbi:unnamed protein product [Penicillium nalgiovense]|nr:unnamed protein product [Penicillium nalgiovense]
MRAGIDSASILLLLLSVLVVARPHDEQIHTATSTHPYHPSSPTFPVPSLPYEMIIESLERISTNCGSLVPLATKVQQTCQVDNFYTFGIIGGSSQNASDSIDFHLVVAGETMGYPIE